MSVPNIESLLATAESHAKHGRWAEAAEAWRAALQIMPNHAKAHYGMGLSALQSGNPRAAHEHLQAAASQAANDPIIWLTLATACNQLGDSAGEWEAVNHALAADPYCLPALLIKAAWLEEHHRRAEAMKVYANALKVAPPERDWPSTLAPQLLHASRFVAAQRQDYAEYLRKSVTFARANLPAAQQARWQEAIGLFSGQLAPMVSQSNQLQVPRLPAIPFFERADFPGLAVLEAQSDAIRAELVALLQARAEGFSPYVAYPPGTPVNQWSALNHSHDWSALHLWRDGQPVQENLALCPVTAAALGALSKADIDGLCPNVMFSALKPNTHIPPHHGETNARLVGHLPLIIPPNCALRVGNEWRTWKYGETLIFDDTIEHEAFNRSDELRVVLIFDLWNPLLLIDERLMVQAMSKASRLYRG